MGLSLVFIIRKNRKRKFYKYCTFLNIYIHFELGFQKVNYKKSITYAITIVTVPGIEPRWFNLLLNYATDDFPLLALRNNS